MALNWGCAGREAYVSRGRVYSKLYSSAQDRCTNHAQVRCLYGADLKHTVWGSRDIHPAWTLRSLLLAYSKFKAHAADSGLDAGPMHKPISWPTGERLLSGLGKSKSTAGAADVLVHIHSIAVPSQFSAQSEAQGNGEQVFWAAGGTGAV